MGSKQVSLPTGQAGTRKKFYKKLGVTVDLDKRLIVLDGTVEYETVIVFYNALFKMQVVSVELPIVVQIKNSGGGNANAGMAIYSMLCNCFAPVVGVVTYYAGSAACYIFQGASERIMFTNSRIALHWAEANLSIKVAGSEYLLTSTIEDFADGYRRLSVINDHLYKVIHERTGMPMGAIKKLCKTSAPINPRQAIQLGLADKVGRRRVRKNKKIGK